MRLLKKSLPLLLIMALVLAMAGCGGTGEEGDKTGDTGDAAREVVIGFSGPLSGPAAQYGMDTLNGIDAAINELNEAGGITVDGQNYTFRLEKLDDMADPTQAVNNAQRLRDQYQIPALFNPVYSAISAIVGINQEQGNEFIVMGYTSTPEADDVDNPLYVSIPPPFTSFLTASANMAWEQGWRKAGMLVTLGAYGDEWRKDFKVYWEGLGGTITADQPANYYTETDYSSQLTAILNTDPDVILVGGPSSPTGLVIEQARTLGYKGGFILAEQAKMDYIVDEVFGGDTSNMENAIGTAAVRDIPHPATPIFHEKYVAEYKVYNTWEAILNYCAMHALARAMEKADTVDDVYAIMESFPAAFPLLEDEFPAQYYGVLDGKRMLAAAVIQMIKDGKFEEAYSGIYWIKEEADFHKLVEDMNVKNAIWIPVEKYAR